MKRTVGRPPLSSAIDRQKLKCHAATRGMALAIGLALSIGCLVSAQASPPVPKEQIVPSARVYEVVRAHGYRYIGEPYFLRGHYVIQSYNRHGRIVLLEVNPRTGEWVGKFKD